jgi:hypothetical protein
VRFGLFGGQAPLSGVCGLAPAEQPLRQAKITIDPRPQGHGSARIVEGLSAIPQKHLAVAFLAVAAQTGGHTVFCDAQTAATEWLDVINGLGGLAAVQTTTARQQVKGASPAAVVGFGAEVFQENTIPGQHAALAIAGSLPGLFLLAMCR